MTTDRVVVDAAELRDAAQALRAEASCLAECSERLPIEMPEAPPVTAAQVCDQICALQTELLVLHDELTAAAFELDGRAGQVEASESRWWDIGPDGVTYGCGLPGGEIVTLTAASSAFGPGISGGTATSSAFGGPAGAVAIIGGLGSFPGGDIFVGNGPMAPNIAIIGGGPSLGTGEGTVVSIGGSWSTPVGGEGVFVSIGGVSAPVSDLAAQISASDPVWGPIFAAGNAVAASPASINNNLATGFVTSQIIRDNAAAEQRLSASISAGILGADYTVRDGLSGAYVDRKYDYEN